MSKKTVRLVWDVETKAFIAIPHSYSKRRRRNRSVKRRSNWIGPKIYRGGI